MKEAPVFRHTCLLGKVCVFAAVFSYVGGQDTLSLSLSEVLHSHPQHFAEVSHDFSSPGVCSENGAEFLASYTWRKSGS